MRNLAGVPGRSERTRSRPKSSGASWTSSRAGRYLPGEGRLADLTRPQERDHRRHLEQLTDSLSVRCAIQHLTMLREKPEWRSDIS
jgi:hypothetical protein